MEEVRFLYTRKDIWHFQLLAFYRLRNIIPLFVVNVIGMALIFYALSSIQVPVTLPLCISLAMIVLEVLAVLLVFQITITTFLKNAKKGGMNVMRISADSMHAKNELVDSTAAWQSIKAFDQDGHNLYFILDTPKFMALIIPLRAFTNAEEGRRFFALAHKYWSERSAQPAPTATAL